MNINYKLSTRQLLIIGVLFSLLLTSCNRKHDTDRLDIQLIVDRTNARLTLFTLDGELIDIRTIPDLTFARTILELDNEEKIFRVELFDRNLTFIGFSDIEDPGGERMRVLWKDDDDHFYIADGRDYPKLVKSRLELGGS